MTTNIKTIYEFSEITENDRDLVGEKALDLSNISKLSIPISDGFVISKNAYEFFLDISSIKSNIVDMLSNVLGENDIEKASSNIEDAIMRAEIPPIVEREIVRAYSKFSSFSDASLSVRSSYIIEGKEIIDENISQATFLNIKGIPELMLAIKACWASMFEVDVIKYRIENKIDHLKTSVAVVVEKMINTEVSGLAFTVSPIEKDPSKILIQGILGIIDGIKKGEVNPDSYKIEKDTQKILTRDISRQEVMFIRNPKSKSQSDALSTINIADKWKEAQKVDDQMLLQISKYATEIESFYKAPRIIEWGIEKGKIWILKSIPLLGIEISDQDKVEEKIKEEVQPIAEDVIKEEHISEEVVEQKKDLPETVIPPVETPKEEIPVIEKKEVVAKKVTKEKEIKTATKVYTNITDIELKDSISKTNIDGMYIYADDLILELKVHPKKVLEDNKQKEYIDAIAKKISSLCEFMGSSRRVIYTLSHLTSEDFMQLESGVQFESKEVNPIIGYRGTLRNIKEIELFNMELEVVKSVRNKYGYKNLSLMVPFVRTPEELTEIKKIISSSGIKRSSTMNLFLDIALPSNIIMIDEFLNVGIDGININLDYLSQMLLGIDSKNPKIQKEIELNNPTLIKSIDMILTSSNKHKLINSVTGPNITENLELIEYLIKHGVNIINIDVNDIVKIKGEISKIERSLILERSSD
ncbi:hypothetical protein M1145_01885 [Patescibacteria group bacterium]|nr:hypothetical protein [Patescibacteria group bacterium]